MSEIDDAIFGFDYEEDDGNEVWLDEEPHEEGCCFPDKCLMPGPHLRSECHTVEMMEEVIAEQGVYQRDFLMPRGKP